MATTNGTLPNIQLGTSSVSSTSKQPVFSSDALVGKVATLDFQETNQDTKANWMGGRIGRSVESIPSKGIERFEQYQNGWSFQTTVGQNMYQSMAVSNLQAFDTTLNQAPIQFEGE